MSATNAACSTPRNSCGACGRGCKHTLQLKRSVQHNLQLKRSLRLGLQHSLQLKRSLRHTL